MDMLADIFNRREQLQGERQALVDKIGLLDGELSDLEAAERVFRNIQSGDVAKKGSNRRAPKASVAGSKRKRGQRFEGSIKELALQILSDLYPRGLRSAAICKLATTHYGREINKNSLTVTLGRLKEEGLVRLEGQTWFNTSP